MEKLKEIKKICNKNRRKSKNDESEYWFWWVLSDLRFIYVIENESIKLAKQLRKITGCKSSTCQKLISKLMMRDHLPEAAEAPFKELIKLQRERKIVYETLSLSEEYLLKRDRLPLFMFNGNICNIIAILDHRVLIQPIGVKNLILIRINIKSLLENMLQAAKREQDSFAIAEITDAIERKKLLGYIDHYDRQDANIRMEGSTQVCQCFNSTMTSGIASGGWKF